MQQADVPNVLAAIPDEAFESPIDFKNASYFLSTIDIEMGNRHQRTAERGSRMPRGRRRLFVAIAALTADAAEYFNLPRDRTVIIGSRIPL
jgi:KUP system potassium uptake protein